jgi:hypothetical protein
MSDNTDKDQQDKDYAAGQRHVARIEAENHVEGYNVHNPSVEINNAVHYAFGGNPELQEKWQKELSELQDAKNKENKGTGVGEQYDKALKEITLTSSSGVLLNEGTVLRAAVDADVKGEDAQEVLDNPGDLKIGTARTVDKGKGLDDSPAQKKAKSNQKGAQKRVAKKTTAKKTTAKKTAVKKA